MKYNPDIHHRRSIRLKGYDYSQAGAYFVTLCTQNRGCMFGEIIDARMVLNDAGRIVADSWEWLADQYDHVSLDGCVVMPNHLHGIIVINDGGRGGSRTAPTGNRKPIGRLIGAFKTVSTKRINKIRKTAGVKLWQRNYFEHIIRNENELNRIQEYIINNPAKWEFDRENPNVSILETVRREGSRNVKEKPEYYNLDAIIAVTKRIQGKKKEKDA